MNSWQMGLGAVLLLLSMVIYSVQIAIFQNAHDTFFYLLQDLAFVPIQVLLITLLVNHMLGIREKKILLKKLNMLIGVFFSEVGTDLAKRCFEFDSGTKGVKDLLIIDDSWDGEKFSNAIKAVKECTFSIDARISDLKSLQKYLHAKRGFLMSLLANPNLLEHDTFTDLMWAVFHLAEELGHRENFEELPEADYAHLSNDIDRVYGLLVTEWLIYMAYLQKDYPYLFSLAMRNNPFHDNASVIIKDLV